MQPKPPQDQKPLRARRSALQAGMAFAAAAWIRPVSAQAGRPFPDSARLGRLQMRVFPEATLDGEPARLSAGARIYDQRNMIVMPAGLSGPQDVLVERDGTGNIHRVWILTPEELAAAQKRERERRARGPGGQGR